MKIGIFGGSFNPPHKMHIKIALYLIENKYLDKVIFVPQGTNYEYKKNLVSNEDRYNMLSIVTNKYSNLSVSEYEFSNEISYTYKTLDYFKNKYSNDNIYFICGADNLDYIDTWKNGKYILNNYNILAINRGEYNTQKILNNYSKYNAKIIVCNLESINISSTNIREKINNNEDIKDLIDIDVLNYIKENNLYKKRDV